MGTITQIDLDDGLRVPAIGFGTYSLNGFAGVNTILSAIDSGYRLIDSAFNYENEGAVGEAVKRSSVPREQLIVTSKLPGRHHRYEEAVHTLQESLMRTGLDYFDLYLIHWPNPGQGLYIEAWQALIDAKKWGWVRSIGVSNFLPEHIDRLIKETGIVPSINQIELHPYFNQREQIAYNKKHRIQTESWSPIGRSLVDFNRNTDITDIAKTHGKSVSQIILRWHVQLGSIPIPKASSIGHQKENLSIFDFSLSGEEMEIISKLGKKNGRLAGQDPAVYEEF